MRRKRLVWLAALVIMVGCSSGTGPQKAGDGSQTSVAAGRGNSHDTHTPGVNLQAPPNWTAVEVPELDFVFNGVAFLNGQFYAWGGDDTRIITSVDGTKWSTVYEEEGSKEISSMAYGPAGFLATTWYNNPVDSSTYGMTMLRSPEGKQWTAEKLPIAMKEVGYFNGKYISEWGVSTDGVKWEVSQEDLVRMFGRFTFYNGEYLATTGMGTILRSSDGLDWLLCSLQFGMPNELLAGNGVVLLLDQKPDGKMNAHTSTDFKTWKNSDLPGVGTLSNAIFTNGRFLALEGKMGLGATNKQVRLMASTDGLNWSELAELPTPRTGTLRVAEGNGRLVVVGIRVAYVHKL